MMLTQAAIKTASAVAKPRKLFDGRGLYLLVNPDGSKWWRFKYRFAGKERGISLGVYPDVSLAQARERREEARKLVADGDDPSAQRKATKAALNHRFGEVAREFIALQEGMKRKDGRPVRSPITIAKIRWQLSKVLPDLDGRPIGTITAAELLPLLKKLEAGGLVETAHRVRARVSQVLRYAVATRRAARDVTQDLRGALTPIKVTHHPALTEPKEIGALMRSIDGYAGGAITQAALKLTALIFPRQGELRRMEWEQLDLKKGEWRVPAEQMKMKEVHIVPLSRQALKILRELRPTTAHGRFVLPSIRGSDRPMSNNTVNAALHQMGFKRRMTAHGFRTVASTNLNEYDWKSDYIELQLAHAERDESRGSYNRALRLKQRRVMMQAWADYLDALRMNKRGALSMTPEQIAAAHT